METNDVNKVYEELINATELAQKAGVIRANTKATIETAVMLSIANGEVVGKNERERNAAAYNLYKKEYEAKDVIEQDYKEKSNDLAIAQIRVNCVRDCIRVEELAKGE